MLKKIYVLILFLICLFTLRIVKANDFELLGKVIYLDPGHGGADPGAIYNDLYESKINLEIAFKLEEILEKEGAIVYLTRYGDYDLSVKNAISRKRSDLSRRANLINNSNCDLYISLHLNSDTSNTWYGAQVFYVDANEDNDIFAKILQEQLSKDLKSKREYKKIYDQYMYRRIKVPGVLLEAGFISNPNERYKLQKKEYQNKLSVSIKDAIITYFNSKNSSFDCQIFLKMSCIAFC